MSSEDQKPYTINDDSFASNPGNVSVKPLVWTKHNLAVVLSLAGFAAFTAYLAYKYSWWILVLTLPSLVVNVFYWTRIREHFGMGDSNGGLVVSVDPPLLAVWTDLGKYGDTYYPVVKVIPLNVSGDVAIGDRFGTVALYTNTDDDVGHWEDFDPIPINYATNDAGAIEQALASYPEEQWKDLEKAIEDLPRPYEPGLYRVDIDGSDWQEA